MGNSKKYQISFAILLLFVVASIVVIILFAQAWSSKKTIDKIEISGNTILNCDQITTIVENIIIGKTKEEIELSQITETIEKNQYIKKAYLSFSGSDEMRIDIIERQPIAYLVHDDGTLVFVDKYMELFPYKLYDKMESIPLIRNVLSKNKIDTTGLENAICIIETMKNTEDNNYKNISEIIYNKLTKNISFILTNNGLKVLFGKNDNLDLKIKRLSETIDLIYKDKIIFNCRYIDLRWNNQLVVKS